MNNKKPTKRKKANPKKVIVIKNKSVLIPIALVLVAIVAIIATVITVKSDSKINFFNTTKSVVSGIDVSEHNGSIKWDKVKNQVDFAFIRVGYRGYSKGNIVKDKTAVSNLKGAKKAKFPVGVYFYSQATNVDEAREEAEFAVSYAKKYDTALPIILDVEYPYGSDSQPTGRLFEASLSKKQMTKVINAFCDAVISAGYTPGIYASTYFYYDNFEPNKINSKAIKWVADYNKKITYTGSYNIWQYTKTASLNGVSSKSVDKNYWYIK